MDFKHNLNIITKCFNNKFGYYDDNILIIDNRYLNNFGLRANYDLEKIIEILSETYIRAILNYDLNIWFNTYIYIDNDRNNIYLSYYKTIELENLIFNSFKSLLKLCISNIYNNDEKLLLLELYNKYYILYTELYSNKNNYSDSDSLDNSTETQLVEYSSNLSDADSRESIPENYKTNITGYNNTPYGPVFVNESQIPVNNISFNIINDISDEVVIYDRVEVTIPELNPISKPEPKSKKTLCEKLYSLFKTIKTVVHSTYKNFVSFITNLFKKEH